MVVGLLALVVVLAVVPVTVMVARVEIHSGVMVDSAAQAAQAEVAIRVVAAEARLAMVMALTVAKVVLLLGKLVQTQLHTVRAVVVEAEARAQVVTVAIVVRVTVL